MGDELWTKTASELAALIADGEVSSRAVVEAHLARMDEVNGHCNAVTLVLAAEALEGADAADAVVATAQRLCRLDLIEQLQRTVRPAQGGGLVLGGDDGQPQP